MGKEKEVRDELYYNALIRLSEFEDRKKVEVLPF
jgi:hypothetical protein